MSNRIMSLTVVLKENYRDDDAQFTIDAIKMIKGVEQVVPHVEDHALHIAEMRAKQKLTEKLWKALEDK